MTETQLPLRKDVSKKETWNLESIFPTTQDWENALNAVEVGLPEISAFQGKLGDSPENLLGYFQISQEISILAMKVMVYSGLEQSTDMSNPAAAARSIQGRRLIARLKAVRAFEIPELKSIGMEKVLQWTGSIPELAKYKHYFINLKRMAEHFRSSDIEEILAMVLEPLPPSTNPAYAALINSELSFKPARNKDGDELEVGQSNITALLSHEDRMVRKTAFEHYADAYLQFKNTIASIQIQAVQRDVFNARVRNYASSLEASLLPNNIPLDVFHNLIDVFKNNLPIWHKYWKIRRKALGYDVLEVSDIKAPLSRKRLNIPYEQAVDWICDGMRPLGDDYVQILRDGCLINRWVDRARNKGKRQGAFSWGSYGTQPFIMMSYADDIFSLSTLAHELGHSMHSFLTRKFQPFIYGHYSLFVAEVASNFNQAMVRNYLLNHVTDPLFQLSLTEEVLSNFHRYFFIMPTLARWELEIHERIEKGGPVNARILTDLCAELFMEGYGDEVKFNHDRIGITWAQFGHMYMNFYVYQYATGIAGAHALVQQVLEQGPTAADKYIEFLKTGNSKYPLDALLETGVDLTDPQPIENAFGFLAEIVERLESLVEGVKIL